jgi:P27 family predicted phage terminase small subunit
MGRRGPPPQPTKLRILSGNPGKRPINHREPQPIGPPQRPDFITGSAAEDWDRVIASMPPGFFTAADTPTLAVFCVSLTLHRAALAQVARGGLTSKGLDGQAIVNPMVGVVAREAQLVLRASDRLGLSPAARVGLEMPAPGGGKFDGLIG